MNTMRNKRNLYESIMKDVSKTVKKHLNEGFDPENDLDEILINEDIYPISANITNLVKDFTNKFNDIMSKSKFVNKESDTGIEISIYKEDDIYADDNEFIESVYLTDDFNTSKKIFALASKYPKRLHIDINTYIENLKGGYRQLFDDLTIYLQKKYKNNISIDYGGSIYFVHMKHLRNINNLINLTLQVLQDFIMFLNKNFKYYTYYTVR